MIKSGQVIHNYSKGKRKYSNLGYGYLIKLDGNTYPTMYVEKHFITIEQHRDNQIHTILL
jgi:hypothetical protein